MKTRWFAPWFLTYRPVAWQGWLVVLLGFAFCVHLALFFDSRVHSVSDLFYRLFPFIVPTILAVDRIAERTSNR
jgi:hypothetical protein